MTKTAKISATPIGETVQQCINEIVSEPVLVSRDKAMSFVTSLASAYSLPGAERALENVHATSDDFWNGDEFAQRYRPYNVRDGVLTIPVYGSLINRMGYALGRYATGYQYIEAAYERGMDDENVERIVMHHHSGGGMVAGCFELAEKIASRRGEKPVIAMVQDAAFSASYALASAADEIVVSASGWTGSVGVLIMHVEFSEMLKDWGVKVTFVHEGEFKVDGNAMEPLSDTARASFQRTVSKSYDRFVTTVANNRGMKESAVRNTEARIYDNEDSIDVGFADREAEMETVIENDGSSKGRSTMTKTSFTQADIDAAVTSAVSTAETAAEAAQATAVAEAATAATAAERTRCAAVIGHENFAGREKLASRLLATEMSAEDIAEALGDAAPAAAAPKGKGSGKNHFAEHMNKDGGAGVEDDEDDGDGGDTPEAVSAGLTKAYVKSGGRMRQSQA